MEIWKRQDVRPCLSTFPFLGGCQHSRKAPKIVSEKEDGNARALPCGEQGLRFVPQSVLEKFPGDALGREYSRGKTQAASLQAMRWHPTHFSANDTTRLVLCMKFCKL